MPGIEALPQDPLPPHPHLAHQPHNNIVDSPTADGSQLLEHRMICVLILQQDRGDMCSVPMSATSRDARRARKFIQDIAKPSN